MAKRKPAIPVSPMSDNPDQGIVIDRITAEDFRPARDSVVNELEVARQPHRHPGHSFFLLEKGTVAVEIDFRKYKVKPMSVVYLHPSQVHRTRITGAVTVSSWSLTTENLNPDYRTLLEDITPAKPVRLPEESFSVICEAVTLAIRVSQLKSGKLNHSLLKDSCNTLVGLVLSQFLAASAPKNTLSRFESVTKAFRDRLEKNFSSIKRPAAYAAMLDISTPYLNECVKNCTGLSVSDQIRQRVILEAKRLLYHSDKSVKEIAEVLGFDDYPYFTRLFSKSTGMTALSFRAKNRD